VVYARHREALGIGYWGFWRLVARYAADARPVPITMSGRNGTDRHQLVRQALTPVSPLQSRRYRQWKDQTRMPISSLPELSIMPRSNGRVTTNASSALAKAETIATRNVHFELQGKARRPQDVRRVCPGSVLSGATTAARLPRY